MGGNGIHSKTMPNMTIRGILISPTDLTDKHGWDFLQQLRQLIPTTCDRINSLGRSKDKSFSLAAAGS